MPPLEVKEGRVVRTPFNELVERLAQAEAALQRSELELLTQKKRVDEIMEALRVEFKDKNYYFSDTTGARHLAVATRGYEPSIVDLFSPMNIY